MFENLYEECGSPFKGLKHEKLVSFLREHELDYDNDIEFSVVLVDEAGNIAATGSMKHNVLMCIAVSEKYRGDGLAARILTALQNHAHKINQNHLFLFTKPKNRSMFDSLGFYEIVCTDDVLLMENTRDGIKNYIASLDRPDNAKTVGAIVANCNPFTAGHRYLIETALKQCDALHLFILSEDRSFFSTEERMSRVIEGTKDLKNVYIHGTSDYLISSATFPTYFIKDKAHAKDANCILDILIFCKCFAPSLGVSKRFVGTEPYDEVTRAYNESMKKILPEYGINLIEIERLCDANGKPISASSVRASLNK